MPLVLALTWCAYARANGVRTEFSFDEVWSLEMALRLPSPLDAFTVLHHDNNHSMNTIWLSLLGYQPDWAYYRIPSVIAGLGTVVLLARIAGRRGELQRLAAILLGASSYLFLIYSTEARGYTERISVFRALNFSTGLAARRRGPTEGIALS